ncbi:MAG: hypothetical protein MRERV_17c038 [Mycoplasmataceae bacterium RV_VA103A]|nr:MAG: hypothetical protein MRERV_17c038 [Mycoplasmataceae bacterium RV_VA103A]
MLSKKLLKSLHKKFRWKFLFLFSLTFFVSYIPFLIRFNLVNNLSYDRGRGHFFYLFGKYPLIEKVVDGKVHVDWSKLLLILFLLYFPLKIIIHLFLNYWKKNYERQVSILLTKKLLKCVSKNKDLMKKSPDEKVYIINNIVPEFSRQFITIPVDLFEIFVDISFAVFSLYFLIDSYYLSSLVPLLIIFILVNLIWYTFFHYSFSSLLKTSLGKKKNYQNLEKAQIKAWLEGLQFAGPSQDLDKLHLTLDNNSQQITSLNFLVTLYQIPELIIFGISILFLFLYYQVYCEGKGGLSWDVYFMANNLQRIFSKVKKGFNLLTTISAYQENYQKIESFFD